jgi:DNA-binding MarR family transcriptional regulator
MTDVKGVLPELMAGLFGRIRGELSDGTMGELRMSHLRVLTAVPPDGLSVTALAGRVGMTKQGCGQFVTQLVGTGHLTTAPDPEDARVRLVLRTSSGDRFMGRVYAALARIEEGFAAEVGERRFTTFKKVMGELGGYSG